jgi:hypothetical protein
MKGPVDNLWTTRRGPVQLIHILAMYLTSWVRWTRLKQAGEPVRLLRRFQLTPPLCLSIGLMLTTMQPVNAATQTDYLKLYAHSRIIDFKQYQCLVKIITKESRWNPDAVNGSHYGLGQMKSQWYRRLDPYRQIDETIRYIRHRYGSMCSAWTHHQNKDWF